MTDNNKPSLKTNQGLLSTIGKVSTFSLPIICNQLLGILPTLASMWILSRLGKDYIASAGLAAPTFYTILTVFVTGFYAVGIKIGHSFGEDNKSDEIGLWFRNGLVLALLLCIPAIVIFLNVDALLLLLGQDPHLVALARPFFQFGALAIIPMLINSVFNQYFTGIGHPKIAFFLSLITLPLIIALSYGLVLGEWGLPKLAMGGINLASFIVDVLMTFTAIGIALVAKWSKPFKVFSKPSRLSYKRCLALFQLGWPIAVQISGELAAMTAVAYLLGLFGASALAAAQITGQYAMLFVMISLGLSSGVSILVSHARGEKNSEQIKTLTLAGVILIIVITLVFAIGFLAFPTTLVDIYLNIHHPAHSQLVHLAVYFMMVAVVYIAFDGIRNVLTNVLRGMQDSKVPMQIGVSCIWLIGLPCAYFAGFLWPGGPIALRFGFVLGVVVATVAIILRIRKKMASLGSLYNG